MSISIGPNPVLDDLILWYDAANTKCYSGEPTTNQISQDYRGESGLATGNASVDLSGLFGFGLVSKEPFAHETWSLDNINKGKLTRYNSFYFDGVNDYLEVADDDAFTFGQDNVSVYTSDFSAGVDGWDASLGTANGNIDSIGGEDDNLRFTADTSSGSSHYLRLTGGSGIFSKGKTYLVSGSYYIPSSQSNIDGIRFLAGGSAPNTILENSSPTLDSWISFSEQFTSSSTSSQIYLYAYALDGGSASFQDAGGDDVFYIRNIQITEIKDDLPFSVSAWVKMEDASSFRAVGKYGTSSSVREFVFMTDGSDKLTLVLNDGSGNEPKLVMDTSLTVYEGEWIHIAASYSGAGPNSNNPFSSAADSIKFFVNGDDVTNSCTATNNGSYSGMVNSSQSLWIGRGSTLYANGHIRNVKIFNRELNAGEVYQLYYSNSLNGVKYSSDFSSGVDGFTGDVRLTSAGNIDSIGGKNDNLRLTVTDTTSNSHYTTRSASFSSGKRTRFSAEIYIPSSNSNVDGVRIGDTINSALFINEASPSLDTWVSISGEATTNNQTLIIALTDGGSTTFQDAGGNDVIYIRNINIVELDTNSEVDFVDEWGEANGGSYTSDFSAGAGGFVDLLNVTSTGNIDGIGGENDTLRIILNTTNGNHVLYKSGLNNSHRHKVSFDYYIPSSNSNVDGFNIALGSGGFLGVHTATLDSWTNYSVEGICTQASNLLLIYLADGSSISFQDAGGDDVMYIKNVQITQIGCVADFDLSNYDDNDKIADLSPSKYIATPQGGALARDRWTPYNLSFSKDRDSNDIATITRDPSSGAFFENTDKLTFYGEHPLYVSNASTGDKVSISFEAKSNITGLFTGLNFFNSGTSAAERVWLNRVLMPDDYEYYYGTSNLIATGDNVGFSILMNRDFSSGWNSISLRKPQIELKDHATNFTSTSRSGINSIVNLANRSQYTGTITNDVKSSGISKIDGVQSFAPINGAYWEFNGVDTHIDTNLKINSYEKFTMECVFEKQSYNTTEVLFGVNSRPFLAAEGTPILFYSMVLDGSSKNINGQTNLLSDKKYYTALTFDGINKTGEIYLNNNLEKGFSFNTYSISSSNLLIGDRNASSEFPFDGKIFFFRLYNESLTSGEVYRNYRAVKTKYGL